MKLRAPAVPLVAIDPYFSVWSMADQLNTEDTKHWTGKPYRLTGSLEIDGVRHGFMGTPVGNEPSMKQVALTLDACSTRYRFEAAGVSLEATFTSPLLLDDLMVASRPASYLALKVTSTDGKVHAAKARIVANDELCLNFKGEFPIEYKAVALEGIACGRVGSVYQKPFLKEGDDVRIDWGYLYAATNAPGGTVSAVSYPFDYGIASNDLELGASLDTASTSEGLFVLAYDDVRSLEYFGTPVDAYWRKNGDTIETVICKAFAEYASLKARCDAFSAKLREEAVACGSEKYAELLSLSYRQIIAAHKLCTDPDGKILFVSKECYSGGFAATVDVSYPSIPLFLLYNPELIKGMLRPIFKYASSGIWFYDFAPHDCGNYPRVNGQTYSHGTCPNWQMPVEECGNMLVMTTAAAVVQKDASFAEENWKLLETWCGYLIREGLDPKNQLCTDDFAGHLAHNCNLAIKSIMGIASFSVLCGMTGRTEKAEELLALARGMAKTWVANASNGDGTFRLAFDRPDTYSIKYNAVWDMLYETGIFPEGTFDSEIESYVARRSNAYGMPLDNRADYTKSDWVLWGATMAKDPATFDAMAAAMWKAYDESESRVPMTDWFDTKTAKQCGFQNRTVQGGLFIRLVAEKGVCRVG